MPDCHESLAGIVAGRIRERYYKPVYVLTDGEEGVKGSGRSIEAYHMYEELNRCSTLLTKFGGHALAAGLSLERENVEAFRRMLNDNCTLSEKDMTERVVIDMEMPFGCVTEAFVQELEILEPFGKGNTKPVFAARQVEILGGRILGKNQNVLKLRVSDQKQTVMDAMYFGDIEAFTETLAQRYGDRAVEELWQGRGRNMTLSITYYPQMNTYMGKTTPQIVITHYQ